MAKKNAETDFEQLDEGVLKVAKIYECSGKDPVIFKKGTGLNVVAVGENYLTVIYHTSGKSYLVEKWDVKKVKK